MPWTFEHIGKVLISLRLLKWTKKSICYWLRYLLDVYECWHWWIQRKWMAIHTFFLFPQTFNAHTKENNISCGLSSSSSAAASAFAYKVQKLYAPFMFKLDLSRFRFFLSLSAHFCSSFVWLNCNRNKLCCIAERQCSHLFYFLPFFRVVFFFYVPCKSLLCKLDLFATNIGTISSTFWFLSMKIRFLVFSKEIIFFFSNSLCYHQCSLHFVFIKFCAIVITFVLN